MVWNCLVTAGRASVFFLFPMMLASNCIAQSKPHEQGPAIISPSHPLDSLGETVYEEQGKNQQNVPVVPGRFMPPVVTKTVAPKYPQSLGKLRETGLVVVEGVVALNGRMIDVRVTRQDDPRFSASALNAVEQYRFKPATLDGKPVAEYIRVVVPFRIF